MTDGLSGTHPSLLVLVLTISLAIAGFLAQALWRVVEHRIYGGGTEFGPGDRDMLRDILGAVKQLALAQVRTESSLELLARGLAQHTDEARAAISGLERDREDRREEQVEDLRHKLTEANSRLERMQAKRVVENGGAVL